MNKNLFVRADGPFEIGTGHITRCIAIAEELKNSFTKIIFLTKKSTGDLIDVIEKSGFEVKILDSQTKQLIEDKYDFNNEIKIITTLLTQYESNLNFLLIDHFGIDTNYESPLRKIFKKIFVIDDLANRKHDCDLLIDQNYYKDINKRYSGLVPKNSITLLGPEYVILRSEFHNSQKVKYQKNILPKKIFVSYGGSDPTNESKKVLDAICSLKSRQFDVTVIAGIHNQNFEKLKKQFAEMKNIKIFLRVDNFSELLSSSELCFGAGGTTTWERLYLGIPSIVTIISPDQKESVEFLSSLGHIINLGLAKDVTVKTYADAIMNIDSEILCNISLKNQKLIDGNGCTRIKKQITQLINDVR